MCGFLSCLWSKNSIPSANKMRLAIESMSKRGPDNLTLLSGNGWAIGHTRLSIIDNSSAANQPFADTTGRYLLAYNGEIYNFREIRNDLVSLGRVFQTDSDTEVLLQLILHCGLKPALSRVRGMFSFVLLDKHNRSMVGARDHFGQKPFHFFQKDGLLAVASEVGSLLELIPKRNPDLNSWHVYLCSNGIIEKDKTFFDGVLTLPAGHILRIDENGFKKEEYFNAADLHDPSDSRRFMYMSNEESMTLFSEFTKSAVERHLISDVPVGVLISGGIDSSIVYFNAINANPQLKTFTNISPGVETIPLMVLPQLMAQFPPSESLFVRQNKEDYLVKLVDFVKNSASASRWGGGPPMADLCRHAKSLGTTVLLGGDGVDEYCAGYKTHASLFESFNGDLHTPHITLALNEKSHFFDLNRSQSYLEMRRNEREQILSRLREIADPAERFMRAVLLQDTGVFLQSCNLPHSDAYSMMESVELRNPMLDIDLVKFVINQPMRRRFGRNHAGSQSKYIFRELARRSIGDLFNAPKEGTRNYSDFISEPTFWNLDAFLINEILSIKKKIIDKKTLFKILNLEILLRSVINKEEDFLVKILTEKGRKFNRLH